MEYRTLGSTGLKVSVVGVGSLGFFRVKAGQKEVEQIMSRAIDLGVNVLDTAYIYGKGTLEEMEGKALAGKRDKWIIISRCHLRDREGFRKSLEESLKRLKTEYIDVYQLHDVTREGEFEELTKKDGVFSVLEEAKKQGKIGFTGISTHATTEEMKKIVESELFDVITVSYNLTQHKRGTGDGESISKTAEEVFPLASQLNMGITIMKPFGGGVLAEEDCQGRRLSPSQVLKYVVQNSYVHTVTPGVDNITQLEEDVKAGDKKFILTEKEIGELLEEGKKWGKDFCHQCSYCHPCSEDINIPQLMRLLERHRREGEQVVEKQYREIEVKADACIECGKCQERCPFQLPIMERMRTLSKLFR